MSTYEIILLVALCVVVLGLLVYIVAKLVKNDGLKKLYDIVTKAIKEAEESGKTGDEKKAYVMKCVEAKCVELGIPYKLFMSAVSKLIEQIVKGYNVISK